MSVRDADRLDLLTLDHLPACPDCGDLSHPSASRCESCGAPLLPPTVIPMGEKAAR